MSSIKPWSTVAPTLVDVAMGRKAGHLALGPIGLVVVATTRDRGREPIGPGLKSRR